MRRTTHWLELLDCSRGERASAQNELGRIHLILTCSNYASVRCPFGAPKSLALTEFAATYISNNALPLTLIIRSRQAAFDNRSLPYENELSCPFLTQLSRNFRGREQGLSGFFVPFWRTSFLLRGRDRSKNDRNTTIKLISCT